MSTTSTSPKTVVVVGATGNQGGSVARRFLREGPNRFHVRGLTRDPSSASARALAALGADMVHADLNDPASLRTAFQGANVIFSVTNYWEPFLPPNIEASRARVQALGGGVRAYAGRVEAAQGRNIVDAAATLDSLDDNGFIVSTLSHAGRCSGGRFTELYHFDAKAEVFPDYVRDKYPRLAAKMSCVQTGFFMSSHQILPDSYLAKTVQGNGSGSGSSSTSIEMRFCTDPNVLVPHLDPVADMGNFVYAVYQMASWCGREYMAEGTTCTWPEWIAAWSKATGTPATYRQITREAMVQEAGGGGGGDEDFGGEIADMFAYTSNPGYDGGTKTLLRAEDLRKVRESNSIPIPSSTTVTDRFHGTGADGLANIHGPKAGVECPMTSLQDWMAKQDWSAILANKAAAHS